jgi:TolC family type I secretion outer membrane protein
MALAAIMLVVGVLSGGQDAVRPGETLKLDRCVAIALERLPALLAARATAEADRSLVREAESAYYPQINWDSSVGRTLVGPRSSLGIQTPSVTFNSYSTGVSLVQNIFDFGRTPAQVRIQKETHRASVSAVETAAQTAVFDVKQSYYGVLQSQRNLGVAEEAVKQFQAHLDQARGQYEVGLAPKYDVTKASVDVGNAQVGLIKARNAVQVAKATLNNAMGVTGTLDYDVEDSLTFEPTTLTLDDALAGAYENRPDLASFVARRKAAEASVSLARAGFFPSLGGSASYDYSGNTFPLARGWSLGLSLSVPLFNGFLTPAQVAAARANLNVLKAGEEGQRQAIELAVEQAYLLLKQAEEVVPVAELNVTAAQENFEIANGSYQEGVGDPIQVADAAVALISAKLAYIQALVDCKVNRASLDLAMGLR